MTNEHIKRCLIPLDIRNVKFESTMKLHIYWKAKILKTDGINNGKMQTQEFSYNNGRNAKVFYSL